jgi:hypothetical protein
MSIGLYLKAAVLVLAVTITGSIVYKVKQAEIDVLKYELIACHDANANNLLALEQAQAETSRANGTCEARVKILNGTIAGINKILNLGKGHEETDSTGDPVLVHLGRMFTENDN